MHVGILDSTRDLNAKYPIRFSPKDKNIQEILCTSKKKLIKDEDTK